MNNDSIYRQPFRMIPPYKVVSRVQILSEVQDYNIKMMNIPSMWKHTRGEGIKVVILDTGLPVHNDLRIKGSKSFIDGYLQDKNGHSTHCAGIIGAVADNGMGICGIAPECEMWCGSVLDGEGIGDFEGIVKGIYWAVDEVGANIINMSLGVPDGTMPLYELEKACDYAYSKGVTVVCAAGNEGAGVGQPACYTSVLAIAAVDSTAQKASFSNYGPEMDYAAGGVDVYSTYLKNGYAKLSGTSMAAPALTGVVALIMADHFKDNGKHLTPAEVIEKLDKVAFDCGDQYHDYIFGNGIPIFKNGDDPYTPDASNPTPEPPKPKPPKVEPKFPCDWSIMFPSSKAFVDAAIAHADTVKACGNQEASLDKMVEAGLRGLQEYFQRVQRVRDRQE